MMPATPPAASVPTKLGRFSPSGVNCTLRYSYVEKYSSDPALQCDDLCWGGHGHAVRIARKGGREAAIERGQAALLVQVLGNLHGAAELGPRRTGPLHLQYTLQPLPCTP